MGRTRSQGPGRDTHRVAREGLALIPHGDEIFHDLSVEDHLDSGAFTPRAWTDRATRKKKTLKIFPPLAKLMKTSVGRLSGGERRMVALGRGLMSDASLFLVDEPTPGLAPKIGKSVLEALMAVELGDCAMVIAEQNVALLEGRVDRVLGMHAGKLKGGRGPLAESDGPADFGYVNTFPVARHNTRLTRPISNGRQLCYR